MARLLLLCFDPNEAPSAAGFAHALGVPFEILSLAGAPSEGFGAERVRYASLGSVPPADGLAPAVVPLAEGFTHVAAVSSMRSKDLLARLAAILDAAMVTDVVEALSAKVFRRPVVAGAAIAEVEAVSEPVVLTFRPAGFPLQPSVPSPAAEPIELSVASRCTVRSVVSRGGARPDLTQAKAVVTGGRPLKDAETYEQLIGGLADALGGAAGATRAAVDNGIASNELQVGQTGKIVAPDLYIAAGVSGSTQHMAGIKDSKVIVAINNDPDAPIFESADLGLVADLFEAIPLLMQRVAQ